MIGESLLQKCRFASVHTSFLFLSIRSKSIISNVQCPLTDLLIVAGWSREKIQGMKSRFLCSQGNTQYMSPLITSLLFPLLGTLSLMHLSSSDLFSLLFQGDMASIKNEKEVQKYLNFCFNIMYFSGHGIFRSD